MTRSHPLGPTWKEHLLRLYQMSFRAGLEYLEYPPLDVAVELNQTCNLSCAMCARVWPSSSSAASAIYGDMDPKGAMDKSVLDAITPWIGSAVAVHAYGFGEPLLSPLFEQLIHRAKASGAHVDFFTNGHLLTPKLADFLVASGTDHVVLSCSGPTEALYRQIHGGASLQGLLDGAAALREAKSSTRSSRPSVHLNVVLQRRNMESIQDFIPLANRLSASGVAFKPLMVYAEEMEEEKVPMDDPKILLGLQRAQALGEELGIGVGWAGASELAGPEGPVCFQPWRSVYVGWNGKVRSDCFGGPLLGDLSIDTPEAIWNGTAAKGLRRAMAHGRWPQSCRFCLEQRLRPLKDDLPDLYEKGASIRPEPLPDALGRRSAPGRIRIFVESVPPWSAWRQQTEVGLVIENSGEAREAHLVFSIYPEQAPKFPERHHGYWTLWNLAIPRGKLPLSLRFVSPSLSCEASEIVREAEGVKGNHDAPGTYLIEISLRFGDTDPTAHVRFKHVFLQDLASASTALDRYWPEQRRRSPSWIEPDRVTLTHLSQAMRRLAQAHQGQRLRIVDIGCGDQPYRPFFESLADQYVGVDSLPGSFVDALTEDSRIDLPSESFDLALCTQVLEHVANPEALIGEAHRLLASSGLLVLSAPLIWETHFVPTDFLRFTEEGLRRLLSRFIVESIDCCGSPTEGLLQARNLMIHRRPGSRLLAQVSVGLWNIVMACAVRKRSDPSFTPNFIVHARKP